MTVVVLYAMIGVWAAQLCEYVLLKEKMIKKEQTSAMIVVWLMVFLFWPPLIVTNTASCVIYLIKEGKGNS